MRIRHPRDAPVAIDVDGDSYLPDADGVYTIPDDRVWLRSYAAAHDCEPDDLLVDEDAADADPETCETVKQDGEVCGRDLPCPYHSDSDDETDSEGE